MATTSPVPHFLPYQGSKRLLAKAILGHVGGRQFARVIEPFAGSGAITLAAAQTGLAQRFLLADSLAPLCALWQRALTDPERLADDYATLWHGEVPFETVRAAFNQHPEPAALLYLVARSVKNALRWSRAGHYNQAPDRRRRGVLPERMRTQLQKTSELLRGKCEVRCGDFTQALAEAGPDDLVYLDPPYQGTTFGHDRRYHQGLEPERLVTELARLVERKVPFLLSYDGATGSRTYGQPLPASLGLLRLELRAGRSSQATLSGRAEWTVESLYVSPALQ